MARTYYEILGVKPDATSEELQAARTRRVQVIEPERLTDRPPEKKAVAAELLRRLDEAFQVLDDMNARELYDSCLAEGTDFAEVRAGTLPEVDSEAEREMRARLEEEYAEAVRMITERLERYVRELDASREWQSRPGVDPWDLVLESGEGADAVTVHLKVLAELHPGDLVATIENAEAALGRSDSGTQAYLLAAGLLLEPGALYTSAGNFNKASWSDGSRGGARAFLAYTDLDGNLPVIPGIDDPEPDLAQLTMAEDVEAPAPQEEPREENFPVLVVDDDRLPFEVVRRALADGPYDVEHATDWPDFRARLEQKDYAVIVLDIQLPTLSGDKLALYVNSNPDISPKPRIVIHSGMEEAVLRRVAAMSGATACLRKGCGNEAIQEAVRDGTQAYFRDCLLTGPW